MQDQQARGHTPPARCVPRGQLPIPQSLGRGRCHHPSLKLALLPGTRPRQSLFPKWSSSPWPWRPRSQFLQNKAGHLRQKVLPTVHGHRGCRDWVNGHGIEAKALWPVSGHTSHRGVAARGVCTPGPAPPHRPPEATLGKVCYRKGIRPPATCLSREIAELWPPPPSSLPYGRGGPEGHR